MACVITPTCRTATLASGQSLSETVLFGGARCAAMASTDSGALSRYSWAIDTVVLLHCTHVVSQTSCFCNGRKAVLARTAAVVSLKTVC